MTIPLNDYVTIEQSLQQALLARWEEEKDNWLPPILSAVKAKDFVAARNMVETLPISMLFVFKGTSFYFLSLAAMTFGASRVTGGDENRLLYLTGDIHAIDEKIGMFMESMMSATEASIRKSLLELINEYEKTVTP